MWIQCTVFGFWFWHYAPDVKNMDISLHTDTQHRAVLINSLYENLSTTQNLPYLKQSSMKCLGKIVDRYPQSDTSDGMEQPASLFLVLYSILCPQWSVSVSHEELLTMQQKLPMILFLLLFVFTFHLLNQEHGVNNERSQSIQSVRHSKQTHRMWPCQKD